MQKTETRRAGVNACGEKLAQPRTHHNHKLYLQRSDTATRIICEIDVDTSDMTHLT